MTISDPPLDRADILPEDGLPCGNALLAQGRQLARTWRVQKCAFQNEFNFRNEIDYKNAMVRTGRIMQHAHLGLRKLSHTVEAIKTVYDTSDQRGGRIDRFGVCLDWSMGYKRDQRKDQPRGTGILLGDAADFAELTNASPAASHFGDFMLGFPASVENCCGALAAGATTIGNLGQYFTFRLPNYDDDVETTAQTVKALGLIAAQEVPVLVHSNLDDGFGAMYEDLTSVLGQAIIERHIVETLIGAPFAVCYGHHFPHPHTRIAFQRALTKVTSGYPGSQIYGATVLYKGSHAENYAGLSTYLLADIIAQRLCPTGHALNPVPVTENERIPNAAEICDAQAHLKQLVEHAENFVPLINVDEIDRTAEVLVREGQGFADRVLAGLAEGGIDTADPFELLLALRRLGGRELERRFGAGVAQSDGSAHRKPVVAATTFAEIQEMSKAFLQTPQGQRLVELAKSPITVLTATSDVHEHGKKLLDTAFSRAGILIKDGGVSSDPKKIAELAKTRCVDVIALSTYNGVALGFSKKLVAEMGKLAIDVPVFIGGRLNEIPDHSNSSLPVDVEAELVELGLIPCHNLAEAADNLVALFSQNPPLRN
jgi:methylmalonyl-CoA mutase cobalamin-binding domain/chain